MEPTRGPLRSAEALVLLAIGDVHLGTRPSRLPEELVEWGVDIAALTPEAALQAAVDRAIEERVDAVVFAGDVVESTNSRFEALRPLESAVRSLLDVGIRVLGVAGNHDVDALPRLAAMIDGFELIGADGHWEARLLEKNGRPAAEILGWSFPERMVRTSPVAQLNRDPIATRHPGIPRIGLLHGDLDASGDVYAPFATAELDHAGLDAWLLGHIHKPSLGSPRPSSGRGPRGYLGSLVGLDPGEAGPHGPWRITIARSGEVNADHLVIAPLRWERVDCEIEEDDGPDEVWGRLLEVAEQVARELQATDLAPRAVGLRPRLVGRTRHYDAIRRHIDGASWKGLNRTAGDTVVFVEKVVDGLTLALDLEDLARGDDPPALLARKLLILAQPGEDRRELLEAARARMSEIANDPRWLALDGDRDDSDPLVDDALVDLLTRSGTAALCELLAQRDSRFEAGA